MHLKLGFFILLLLFLSSYKIFANILPVSSGDIPNGVIGLYQTDKRITIYEKPNCLSKILLDKQIDYFDMMNIKTDDMFGLLVPQKELGYLYVVDTDDDWLCVIYNKNKNLKGWVYKNDDFQFLPWVNFYDLYGRKYGLEKLKNSPDGINEVHSQPDENSRIISKVIQPKQIKLTSIEGNWMLVSILDYTGNIHTGYIQWRNINGQLYLFPIVK